MDEGILDTERKKRKPVSVVKTGLFFGVISLLLTAAIFYISYLMSSQQDEKPPNIITIFAFFGGVLTPLLTSMVIVAAWGNRKYHFFKILCNGLICYNTLLVSYIIFGYIVYLIKNPNKYFLDEQMLKGMLGGNFIVLIIAFVLWLIPDKLPYFRKQMEL